MEIFAVVVSGIALVVAMFAWGELAWGNNFFGHKIKVKCFPVRPEAKKPILRDNVMHFSIPVPVVLAPRGDVEAGESELTFPLDHIVTIPKGYIGVLSLKSAIFGPSAYLTNGILPPGWSGELLATIGNSTSEKVLHLGSDIPCVSLYIVQLGSPIKIRTKLE
jgi:hypothetical protein